MERMNRGKLAKKVYMNKVNRKKKRGGVNKNKVGET